MRLLPPEPAPGDKITAELVRELIRCIRERQLLKSADYTVSSGPNGTTIKFKSQTSKKQADGPLPYEVRWDSTLNSGSGGWKIYLPTEHLLSYDGEDIATSDIDGITVIQDADNQDTPWYSLDDISDSDSNVYLVITIPDDSAEPSDPPAETTAEFSATEGQATTGEEVINICIADISYTSGPPVEIDVKQSVVGALYLFKDETIEPDDVSTEFIPEAASGATPDGDEGKLQIKGFKAGTPVSASTLGANLSDPNSASSSGHVLVRTTSGTLVYMPIGNVSQPDGVSIDKIPDPAEGEEPDGDEGKLEIKGFKACDPESSSTLGEDLSDPTTASTSGHVLVRTIDNTLEFKPIGNVTQLEYDNVSIGAIPDPPEGEQPTGDEGKLEIKGFKAGTPVSSSTLGADLTNSASAQTSGHVLVRTTGGTIAFKPIGNIGSPLSGSVVFLEDITWDMTNHTLVKVWATLNLATGAVTHNSGTPTGKTATISTTPISSLLPSSSS